MIDKKFWQDVERPLKYVLYGDTDSLFVHIPWIDTSDIEGSIEKSTKAATDINNLIKNFLDSTLLPKLHVDPQFNKTKFKTEFTCNAIMFLDIKKNYSYRMTTKEGKVCKPGEDVQYTGIPVVKSNTSEFSRELLVDLIEKIVLAPKTDKPTRMKNLGALVKEKFDNLNTQVSNGNFKHFATPVRWGATDYTKDPSHIVGMRLYNSISNTETFKPLSSGLQIPIEIKNDQKIKSLDLTTHHGLAVKHLGVLNYICVPYNYDSEQIFELFKEYNISIVSNLWEKLTDGAIIQKIVDLIKK